MWYRRLTGSRVEDGRGWLGAGGRVIGGRRAVVAAVTGVRRGRRRAVTSRRHAARLSSAIFLCGQPKQNILLYTHCQTHWNSTNLEAKTFWFLISCKWWRMNVWKCHNLISITEFPALFTCSNILSHLKIPKMNYPTKYYLNENF